MAEIQTLARGLQIINALADAQDGMSITELAERFDMDKGNVSRFLQTLANYAFAERAPDTRRYYLGPQVVRLSRSLLNRMKLREVAKPFLDELVTATGECAHLAILAQGQALYIDQAESPSALRVTTGVGTMAPLHCTALGKVLLAFADAPVAENLDSYTIRTITDPGALQSHLDRVRKQGFAIDDEEFEAGVRCIAVPVCDYRGRCVAAIGISGPTSRMSLENLPKVAQTVQEIGNSLSARLSFRINGGACG
jgi:IclR family acetate operon transcriptional repressor